MLRVSDVSFRTDGFILKDIKFEVEKGDFIAIVGPNGSGKTTLLRLIAKVLRPTGGVIYLDGRDLKEISVYELARIVGVVPQEYNLDLGFKAEEIVLMGRFPYLRRFQFGDLRDLEIAYESMKMVRCEDLIGKVVRNLSGGEKQKVMIARALAQRPRLLLLDEPVSHLDINHQIEIMNLLKSLTGKGMTVIATFHDLNLAIQYCNKVLMIKDGEIVSYGRTEEVLNVENIRYVFGIDVIIKKNPVTGKYYIIPAKVGKRVKSRVHMICGGGSGSRLMMMLKRASAGVLNILDSDWETAIGLGFDVISEAPFSPITDENHEKNLRMIEKSEHVILTDVQFGFGNLKNLEASSYAGELGKLIVIDRTPIEKRDWTNGLATRIYRNLKGLFVRREEEVFEVLTDA